MSTYLNIFLGLCNILYNTYELLIQLYVSVIYIQKSDNEREEILKNIITICNNYCKDVSIDIGWKCAEIVTVTKERNIVTVITVYHIIGFFLSYVWACLETFCSTTTTISDGCSDTTFLLCLRTLK